MYSALADLLECCLCFDLHFLESWRDWVIFLYAWVLTYLYHETYFRAFKLCSYPLCHLIIPTIQQSQQSRQSR